MVSSSRSMWKRAKSFKRLVYPKRKKKNMPFFSFSLLSFSHSLLFLHNSVSSSFIFFFEFHLQVQFSFDLEKVFLLFLSLFDFFFQSQVLPSLFFFTSLRPNMATDPWTCVAKCFSKWSCIQTQMSFIIIWSVVLLALSGYTIQNDGGSFSQISRNNTMSGIQPYADFSTTVCNASPYIYLRPFHFTYTVGPPVKNSLIKSQTNPSSSSSSLPNASKPTFCGFPSSNSSLRLTITSLGLLSVFILLFNTPLSLFGKYIFIVYGFLFFTSLVLDSNASSTGEVSCNNNFQNTNLEAFIKTHKLVLQCNPSIYAGISFIDIMMSVQYFFLSTSWGLCKDRYSNYNKKEDKSDNLKKNKAAKSPTKEANESPMKAMEDVDVI